MKKTIKILCSTVFVLVMLILGALIAQRMYLQENVIRLHIRANSDSIADQQEKYAVRDKLLEAVSDFADRCKTAQDARECLQEQIPYLEEQVNGFLVAQNSANRAKVSLRQEAFETRVYDQFALPAGLYHALIVEIGSAEGQNWWCVVFPSLCLQDFYTAASVIDMDQDMQNTLTAEPGYEVRFFLLECLGKIQNFFYNS